ncbi:MAG: hypothetical protein HON65_08855 [Rhodospirillales bacterium]|nr:hypothetical protein [Rhodospirillales bacterium]
MEKVKAVMSWLLKSEADKPEAAQHKSFAPSGTDTDNVVSILIADLDGPEGASATSRITDILVRVEGAMVKRTGRTLSIPTKAKTPVEGLLSAAETGREWLKAEQADILIWGRVEPAGKVLSLRFLPLNGAPEGRAGAIGVGDELDLPLHYSTEVDDVIAAATLCASSSTQVGSRTTFISKLNEIALQVEPLGAIEIPGLDQVQLVAALQVIANVMFTNARGNLESQKSALTVYLRAIRLIPKDLFDGARQALLYSQYAAALQAVGAKSNNLESYEQAVESYKSAIAVLDMAVHPHDWALSNIRLGLASYHLARRSEQPKIMNNAILALEQSLRVFTKDSHPGRWAEVKNHIGVVMTTMGESLSNNTLLERAVAAFDESLDIRKREQVVLLWAQTTNNLGAAAFALAKRTEDMALMQQAAYAFEGAMQVYLQIGQEKRAHIIGKNLNRTKEYLSGG